MHAANINICRRPTRSPPHRPSLRPVMVRLAAMAVTGMIFGSAMRRGSVALQHPARSLSRPGPGPRATAYMRASERGGATRAYGRSMVALGARRRNSGPTKVATTRVSGAAQPHVDHAGAAAMGQGWNQPTTTGTTMPCHAMPRHATIRHHTAPLYSAPTPQRPKLHSNTLPHTTPHHNTPHHTTPIHTTPHHTTPHHTTPHHTTPIQSNPIHTNPHQSTPH